MSALSYATIVSGPRDMSASLHKSYQMDRALGIPSIGLTSVFRSAIESIIHGELFGTARIVVITGTCAEALNEVLSGVTDQHLLTVAEAIQAPPLDSELAGDCVQAY